MTDDIELGNVLRFTTFARDFIFERFVRTDRHKVLALIQRINIIRDEFRFIRKEL